MRKGDRTRAAILDEAANLASRVGLNGVTVGALATHTGMSKSGLFQHFGSKERLQVETLKASVERFVVTVVRPALRVPRGVARVRALFDLWIHWETCGRTAGGCLFIAASAELDDQPGPARDYVVSHRRLWMDAITTTARKAVETGDFRRDLDAEQFTFEFLGILLSFHQSARLMRDPTAPDRARAMFERLLADAGSPPSQPRGPRSVESIEQRGARITRRLKPK